mgnify:CR=1 FL=1
MENINIKITKEAVDIIKEALVQQKKTYDKLYVACTNNKIKGAADEIIKKIQLVDDIVRKIDMNFVK